MKLGPLDVVFHRTVRVAEGRTPANLPPSLGRMTAYEVSKYRDRCPDTWEDCGVFVGLHDQEALWLSFHAHVPVALLVGAGAVNALTGKALGTKLEAENYLVTPPQPWLDGWKATDGTVYQFVGTPYEKGTGLSVGEQVLGAESKTGGIGLALFESKAPLAAKHAPRQGSGSAYGDVTFDAMPQAMCSTAPFASSGIKGMSAGLARSAKRQSFSEMGVGKGGKIIQKIYADPYGLDAWKELPSQTRAVYLVHAALLAEITGQPIAAPVTQEDYNGGYFGLDDAGAPDVAGTETFTGLKSVFADTTTKA